MAAALLGLTTLALFWRATQCGFINYDDPDYVTSNPQVQKGLTMDAMRSAFTDNIAANWHPVTMLSHTLDCQLYGLNPWGHHFTSILLHSLNAILVFVLLKRMTGAFWPSWFVAAFFAVSPLRVESVVWVSERKDVLSGFLGLLALIFYVRFAQGRSAGLRSATRPVPALTARPGGWNYALALFFLALGLLSKPMLVTWPFVMLLLDYWPLDRRGSAEGGARNFLRNFKTLVGEKIPFFALTLAGSLVTYYVQQREGAMGGAHKLPAGLECENAVLSYCRYLGKLFWPSDLAVIYPFPLSDSYPLIQIIGAGMLLAAITLAVWWGRHRRPYGLMGWLWYCGTLVPAIGLVQVGTQAMADRYTYLPSLGFYILVVWSLAQLAVTRRFLLVPLLAAAGLYLVAFSAVTFRQIGYWRNGVTLFQHTVAVTVDNAVACNSLGLALAAESRLDEAISQYVEALRIRPNYGECHKNLGLAYDRKDRHDQALQEFETAGRLKPGSPEIQGAWGAALVKAGSYSQAIEHLQTALALKPDAANTHAFLGLALADQGQTNDAVREYQTAIRLQPTNAPAHSYLGVLLGNQGRLDEAVLELETALRSDPDDAATHGNLGLALEQQGKIDPAIDHFKAAVRLKPGDAAYHERLGALLDKQDLTAEAVREYETALRLQPELVALHAVLGADLLTLGNSDEAIFHLRAALHSKPDDASAHNDLGNALDGKGQADEAIREYQEAIRLQPSYAPAHSNLGAAYGKQGKVEEAIAQLREAARLQNDDPLTFYNLGMALYQQGHTNEAATQLSRALDLKPDFAAARNALNRLRTP